MPEEVSENIKEINIKPLSKGRRMLLFLADFFLSFIIGILAFHLMVYPIGTVAIHTADQYESYVDNASKRNQVLYGNGLLYFEGEKPSSLDESLQYTCKMLVYSYIEPSNEQYEVIKKYFTTFDDDLNYIDLYKELNESHPYFDINEGTVSLKEAYKEEFGAMFNPGDAMSSQGEEDYKVFTEKIFLKSYETLLSHVGQHDLVYEGVSYKAMQTEVERYNRNMDVFVISCALISYVLAVTIDYLLVPFTNRRRRTLAMMFLKAERVTMDELRIGDWKQVILFYLYSLAFDFAIAFFLPWGVLGFNELFSVPVLFPLAIAALVLSLGSMGVILFNQHDRSIIDVLTRTVMISEASLDEIYQAKGYHY